LLRGLLAKGPSAGGREELSRPFTIDRSAPPALAPGASNAYQHAFCGMTIQYLLFWGMDSGLLFLRERRRGIWRRFRAAPVGVTTVLLGKALATSAIALLQIAVTFAAGYLLFGVGAGGTLPGFVLLAGCLALLSAAVGLFIAAVGGEEGRARSVAIVVIL